VGGGALICDRKASVTDRRGFLETWLVQGFDAWRRRLWWRGSLRITTEKRARSSFCHGSRTEHTSEALSSSVVRGALGFAVGPR
jgi:hypothetical protein